MVFWKTVSGGLTTRPNRLLGHRDRQGESPEPPPSPAGNAALLLSQERMFLKMRVGAGQPLLSQARAQQAQGVPSGNENPAGTGESNNPPLGAGEGPHLSLGVLAVFLRLLPGLVRAPRPPVPVVSGPLGSQPDLPPGQSLVSNLLVFVLWLLVVVI